MISEILWNLYEYVHSCLSNKDIFAALIHLQVCSGSSWISIVAENLDTVIWNALASSLYVYFLLYLHQKINSMNIHSLLDKCFQWFITKKKSVLCHTNVTPHLALIDFSMHSTLDAWQLALDDTSHPGGKQTECSKFCIGCWEQSVVWSLRRNSLTPRLSGRQSCPLWPLQRLAPLIDRGWSWL